MLAAVGLVGCLTFDGVLAADGSGTFAMTYALRPGATEAQERGRYTSSHVTLESFAINDDHKTATLTARVDDVTHLDSVAAFSNVAVARTPAGSDAERLTITITNQRPVTAKDEGRPGPQITLTLPGPIREANRDARVSGDRVTWSFSAVEFVRLPSVDLAVTYATAAAADPAPAVAPPAAKPAP